MFWTELSKDDDISNGVLVHFIGVLGIHSQEPTFRTAFVYTLFSFCSDLDLTSNPIGIRIAPPRVYISQSALASKDNLLRSSATVNGSDPHEVYVAWLLLALRIYGRTPTSRLHDRCTRRLVN
jgi:hypothetical protein